MEAGEYGLARDGTCFVARRLTVVAVPGLCCEFRGVFWVRRDFVFFSFFFLRTHTACCKHGAALSHLPLH